MKAKVGLLPLLLFALLTITMLPGFGEKRERLELKPVLIVMDVQNIWMPQMSDEDRKSAPRRINELIGVFREFKHPIIRVYHSDPERGPKPNTEPFEFPDSIAVTDNDLEIIKTRPSAFTNTDLERILEKRERNIVFICGLSATGCALATYFGAMDRELMAVMVEGTLLSGDAAYTKMIEDICTSMTLEEVKKTLKNPFL